MTQTVENTISFNQAPRQSKRIDLIPRTRNQEHLVMALQDASQHNLTAKMEPWTRPLLDVMREFYRPQDIVTMIEDQTVEIAPLAYMRGRTFKNAWIIADEMQNATPAQVKMLMTRIGANSRIVITGDVEQADRSTGDNGLMELCERLDAHPVNGIAVCPLEARDVQRHRIIGDVLKLYSR